MDAPVLPRFTVGEVVQLLNACNVSPTQWKATCPACQAAGESLSIGIGRQNILLLRCSNGCTFRTILSALDLIRATAKAGSLC